MAGVLGKLSNNRAKGPDATHGEYTRCGGAAVTECHAWTVSQLFEGQEQPAATQESNTATE